MYNFKKIRKKIYTIFKCIIRRTCNAISTRASTHSILQTPAEGWQTNVNFNKNADASIGSAGLLKNLAAHESTVCART